MNLYIDSIELYIESITSVEVCEPAGVDIYVERLVILENKLAKQYVFQEGNLYQVMNIALCVAQNIS